MRLFRRILFLTCFISVTAAASPDDSDSDSATTFGDCSYVLGFSDTTAPGSVPLTAAIETVRVKVGPRNIGGQQQSESATVPLHDKDIEIFFNLGFGEDSLYHLQITSIFVHTHDHETANDPAIAVSAMETETKGQANRQLTAYAIIDRHYRKDLPTLSAHELSENEVAGVKANHSYQLFGVQVSCSFATATQAL